MTEGRIEGREGKRGYEGDVEKDICNDIVFPVTICKSSIINYEIKLKASG